MQSISNALRSSIQMNGIIALNLLLLKMSILQLPFLLTQLLTLSKRQIKLELNLLMLRSSCIRKISGPRSVQIPKNYHVVERKNSQLATPKCLLRSTQKINKRLRFAVLKPNFDLKSFSSQLAIVTSSYTKSIAQFLKLI